MNSSLKGARVLRLRSCTANTHVHVMGGQRASGRHARRRAGSSASAQRGPQCKAGVRSSSEDSRSGGRLKGGRARKSWREQAGKV